jgi:hypothetical protein
MAKKRVTLYLDGDTYDRCRALLQKSPSPQPISHLIEELLDDWYQLARLGPDLQAMSPEERELFLYRQGLNDLRDLLRQVDETVRKAREGGGIT